MTKLVVLTYHFFLSSYKYVPEVSSDYENESLTFPTPPNIERLETSDSKP